MYCISLIYEKKYVLKRVCSGNEKVFDHHVCSFLLRNLETMYDVYFSLFMNSFKNDNHL